MGTIAHLPILADIIEVHHIFGELSRADMTIIICMFSVIIETETHSDEIQMCPMHDYLMCSASFHDIFLRFVIC